MEFGAKIIYEFSKFRLDLQQRLLMSGADGTPIPLPPKVFKLNAEEARLTKLIRDVGIVPE